MLMNESIHENWKRYFANGDTIGTIWWIMYFYNHMLLILQGGHFIIITIYISRLKLWNLILGNYYYKKYCS